MKLFIRNFYNRSLFLIIILLGIYVHIWIHQYPKRLPLYIFFTFGHTHGTWQLAENACNICNFRVPFLYLPGYPSVVLSTLPWAWGGFCIATHQRTIAMQSTIRKKLPKIPPTMAPDGISDESGLLSVSKNI